MSALPRPKQTLLVLQSILDHALDQAARLDLTIAELESDAADATTDWATQAATLRLVAARDDQQRLVREAALTLRRIDALRASAGMGRSLLNRIFTEYNR